MPSPSQPTVHAAPVRYQVRYSGSFQPPKAAMASVAAAMPKKSMPMPHASWNAPRRSRHWSNRANEKTRASTAVAVVRNSSAVMSLSLVGGDEAEQ